MVTSEETAVFETSVDLGFDDAPMLLTFTLDHQLGGKNNLGKFRLSATTDDRSLFADGLVTGGDVTANWVELVPLDAVSAAGATMTVSLDNSILVGGLLPDKDTYTVTATTSLKGITGFRLEALEDALLPTNGPGRAANGNFVLTNFSVGVAAVPEPTGMTLAACGLAALLLTVGRRRRKPAS